MHCNSCMASVSKRTRGLHNPVQKLIGTTASTVGTIIRVDHEPAAADLMGGTYTEDDTRVLFPNLQRIPRNLCTATSDLIAEFEAALRAPGHDKDQQLRAVRAKMRSHVDRMMSVLSVDQEGAPRGNANFLVARYNKGIRPDVALTVEVQTEDGEHRREQLWIDVTGTHPCGGALDRGLVHLRSMANDGRHKSLFTPVLTSADTSKRTKYRPME